MEIRSELKYTKDHEWVLIEGETLTLGISDFAQAQLGDIVFVELPEVGTVIDEGDAVGNIESVKAVSEVFCPASGEVFEVNKELEDNPETINQHPYDEGWILKLKIDHLEEDELMNEEEYAEYVKNAGH